MPEWLLKEDNLTLPSDKDRFLDRSIQGFLGMLTALRTQGHRCKRDSKIRPTLLVIGVFLMIFLVSASGGPRFPALAGTLLLVWLSMKDGESIRRILKVVLGSVGLTAVVLMPSVVIGYGSSVKLIILKVAITTLSVGLLGQTLRWDAITGALRRFMVPDLFILVLDITLKYLVLLGGFSLNLLYALRLRSVGRNTHKSQSLSGIAGSLFIHSKDMAEELCAAMECRGFTGEYRIVSKRPWTWMDYSYVIAMFGLVLVFAGLGR